VEDRIKSSLKEAKVKWENVEMIGVLMEIMHTGGFESPTEVMCLTSVLFYIEYLLFFNA